MLENHSTSNRIESSPTAPDKRPLFNLIETELIEESLILERVQRLLEQLNANEDNDYLSPLFELCLQELERTRAYRGKAILHSRKMERLAAENVAHIAEIAAKHPLPSSSITPDELNRMALDLGTIRTNCIALMHFCEDSHAFNGINFKPLDLNNGDAYLISSNSVELATQWVKRITEGGV